MDCDGQAAPVVASSGHDGDLDRARASVIGFSSSESFFFCSLLCAIYRASKANSVKKR
jgi:hypothetical protein